MSPWSVGWPVASTSCHAQPPWTGRLWGVAASGTERLLLSSRPLVPDRHPPSASPCSEWSAGAAPQRKQQRRKEVRNG
jgi:hypothetical protein